MIPWPAMIPPAKLSKNRLQAIPETVRTFWQYLAPIWQSSVLAALPGLEDFDRETSNHLAAVGVEPVIQDLPFEPDPAA